jgi:hypothetical protein
LGLKPTQKPLFSADFGVLRGHFGASGRKKRGFLGPPQHPPTFLFLGAPRHPLLFLFFDPQRGKQEDYGLGGPQKPGPNQKAWVFCCLKTETKNLGYALKKAEPPFLKSVKFVLKIEDLVKI